MSSLNCLKVAVRKCVLEFVNSNIKDPKNSKVILDIKFCVN